MTNLELDRQPDYATVNELADRLGLGRRSALNVMNTCAAHLGIPIYTAERNQLQIKRADFDQVVEPSPQCWPQCASGRSHSGLQQSSALDFACSASSFVPYRSLRSDHTH